MDVRRMAGRVGESPAGNRVLTPKRLTTNSPHQLIPLKTCLVGFAAYILINSRRCYTSIKAYYLNEIKRVRDGWVSVGQALTTGERHGWAGAEDGEMPWNGKVPRAGTSSRCRGWGCGAGNRQEWCGGSACRFCALRPIAMGRSVNGRGGRLQGGTHP